MNSPQSYHGWTMLIMVGGEPPKIWQLQTVPRDDYAVCEGCGRERSGEHDRFYRSRNLDPTQYDDPQTEFCHRCIDQVYAFNAVEAVAPARLADDCTYMYPPVGFPRDMFHTVKL
jgi:hypothetical protein